MTNPFDVNTATYDEMREYAREQSQTNGGYSAVVEITTYMSDRTRLTVMHSRTPIRNVSRGGQFVGVMSQFRNGQPCPIC
jgi:hypothetical protein